MLVQLTNSDMNNWIVPVVLLRSSILMSSGGTERGGCEGVRKMSAQKLLLAARNRLTSAVLEKASVEKWNRRGQRIDKRLNVDKTLVYTFERGCAQVHSLLYHTIQRKPQPLQHDLSSTTAS